MLRFLTVWGIALGLAAALVGPAAADPAPRVADRPAAATPGAFCPPSGCRDSGSVLWNGAAFGLIALAMGWRAGRRPEPDA